MSSSIKLKTTIDLTTRFINNAPLLYTNSGDLAYSIGDYVRQFMLAPPFAWRWNRGFANPIVCQPGQTDYQVTIPDFGWIEKAAIAFPSVGNNSANILTATRTSGVVTIQLGVNPTTLGFTGSQIITVADANDPSFNGYQAFTILSLTSNSISYAQAGTNSTTAGGIVINYSSSSPNVLQTKELTLNETLVQETVLGQPAYISSVLDDSNGNITFRLMPVPDQTYTLNIIYQKAAPKFISVDDTWSPLPDYYSYLYNLGFLAKSYEYKGDERFAFTQQEFLKQVIAANGGISDTVKNIFLEPKLVYDRETQNMSQTGAISRQGRVG